MRTGISTLASTLIALSTITVGCGSDPPPAASAPTGAIAPIGAATTTPPATSPAPASPDACSEIAGSCHEHAGKPGPAAAVIKECHELGHAHKLEACVSRKKECLDACAGHAH